MSPAADSPASVIASPRRSWATDYLGRAMASQVTGINLRPAAPTLTATRRSPSAPPRHAQRGSERQSRFMRCCSPRTFLAISAGPRQAPAATTSLRVFRRPDGGLDVLAAPHGPVPQEAPAKLPVPTPSTTRSIWRLRAPAWSAGTGATTVGRRRRGRRVRRPAADANRGRSAARRSPGRHRGADHPPCHSSLTPATSPPAAATVRQVRAESWRVGSRRSGRQLTSWNGS